MKLAHTKKLNHIKIQKLQQSSLVQLFRQLKLSCFLKELGFNKKRGIPTNELLHVCFLVIMQRSRSINEALITLCLKKYKTPINDLLNNYCLKWVKLLSRLSRVFMSQHSQNRDECKIIIDDTKKEKTGKKADFLAYFFDHSQQRYYKGFQNIVMAFYNGVVSIPIEFKFKVGRKRLKRNKDQREIPKGSETYKELRESKQSKYKIVLKMLKRIMRRKDKFRYILWDSWYNSSESIKYIFEKVVCHDIHLISMQKRSNQIFRWENKEHNIKRLYNLAGKWQIDSLSGIKYKSILVEYLDVNSSEEYSSRQSIGKIKMCFYKYPKVKNYKILISTDLKLTEIEVLQHYLSRWSIEVMFKDLKQYFGYDQNKNSKYSAMVSDFTIRSALYIFFAHLKMKEMSKSIGQLVLQFYQELKEIALRDFINSIFVLRFKEALDYALELGYETIQSLRADVDYFLTWFFSKPEFENNIVDAYNVNF